MYKVMGIHLSQETQLLLLCARTQVTQAEATQIKSLAQTPIHWDHLMATAHKQGVLPLVTSTLRQHSGNLLPPPVQELMTQRSQSVAMRNLWLTQELISVLKAFKSAHILALPFKGPTLATLAYGGIALRQFLDLDILIPRHQIPLAKQLLLESGYQTKLSLSAQEEENYLHTQLGYDFFDARRGLSVELHWNLLQRWLSYPSRVDEIWEQPQPIQMTGMKVHTLATHHLLPYLCAHATKHGWMELKWICDVAELIRHHPDLDWDRILGQAESLRSLRMLLLGLGLAQHLLGTQLPQEIEARIQADATVPVLVREVETRLFAKPAQPGSWQEHLFFLRSREHLEDRRIYLSHLVRLALEPSDADRSWAPLPPSLGFLYLLLRPFRVLLRSIVDRHHGGSTRT